MLSARKAARMGRKGGKASTQIKTRAARANGQLGGRPRHQWTDADRALLGTISDQAIADRLGINRSTVIRERERLNLPGRPRGRP